MRDNKNGQESHAVVLVNVKGSTVKSFDILRGGSLGGRLLVLKSFGAEPRSGLLRPTKHELFFPQGLGIRRGQVGRPWQLSDPDPLHLVVLVFRVDSRNWLSCCVRSRSSLGRLVCRSCTSVPVELLCVNTVSSSSISAHELWLGTKITEGTIVLNCNTVN